MSDESYRETRAQKAALDRIRDECISVLFSVWRSNMVFTVHAVVSHGPFTPDNEVSDVEVERLDVYPDGTVESDGLYHLRPLGRGEAPREPTLLDVVRRWSRKS